jgi:hypothetical protein
MTYIPPETTDMVIMVSVQYNTEDFELTVTNGVETGTFSLFRADTAAGASGFHEHVLTLSGLVDDSWHTWSLLEGATAAVAKPRIAWMRMHAMQVEEYAP